MEKEHYMFKRIELWAAILAVFLSVVVSILAMMYLSWVSFCALPEENKFPEVRKWYRKVLISSHLLKVELFGPHWMLAEFQRFSNKPKVFINSDRTIKGKALLISRFDQSIQQSVIELISLDTFDVLQRWVPDTDSFYELSDQKFLDKNQFQMEFSNVRNARKHPYLLSDGVLFTAPILTKIDLNGDLVWQNYNMHFHHTIEVDHEGYIWAPASDRMDENSFFDQSFISDVLTRVSPEGKIVYQKSVLDILLENNFRGLIISLGRIKDHDPLHLNDIQPVLTDGPYWQRGDVFVSLRNVSMVFLYRPATNKVLWYKVGPFIQQHDVDILDDQRISIFNNNTLFGRTKNNILIYDFEKMNFHNLIMMSLRIIKLIHRMKGCVKSLIMEMC